MDESKSADALRLRTAEAAAAAWPPPAAGGQGTGHSPGEIYVLPQTADFPLEWLVIAQRATAPSLGRHSSREESVHLVPVDTQPLLGGGDFDLSPHDLSGPLSVRSRHGLWVREQALSEATCSGTVDAAVVDMALAQSAELSPSSLLEQEAELDPEYADWQDLLAEARQKLAPWQLHGEPESGTTANDEAMPPPPPSAAQWLQRTWELAAVVLLLLLARAYSEQRNTVNQLTRPLSMPDLVELSFAGPERSGSDSEVQQTGPWFQLVIALPRELPEGDIEVEIENSQGRVVWASGRLENTMIDPVANIPADHFPQGTYEGHLYSLAQGQRELIESQTFVIRSDSSG